MKLQLIIDFENMQGDPPTAEQRDAIVVSIIGDWPNWIYAWGDDNLGGVARIDLVAEWLEVEA